MSKIYPNIRTGSTMLDKFMLDPQGAKETYREAKKVIKDPSASRIVSIYSDMEEAEMERNSESENFPPTPEIANMIWLILHKKVDNRTFA